MADISDAFIAAFPDGYPVAKPEARAIGPALEVAIGLLAAAISAGNVSVFATKTALLASSTDATGAYVYADGSAVAERPVQGNNGLWVRESPGDPWTYSGSFVLPVTVLAELLSLQEDMAGLGDLAHRNDVNTAQIADGSVTGPKLGAASVTTAKVADKTVTYAKLQDVAAGRILGRRPGTAGPVQEIAPADARADLGVPSTTETAEAIDTAVAGEAAARTTAIGTATDSIVSYIRAWRRLGVRPGLTLGGRVGRPGR